MTDGVLALQGDYFAHGRVLDRLGRKHIYVKTPQELAQVNSLIIPGGESTTIRKLAKSKEAGQKQRPLGDAEKIRQADYGDLHRYNTSGGAD